MGKFKRGGYFFYTWIGDHAPRHVHIYEDDRLICKWDLELKRVLEGAINSRILKALIELEEEKKL